jgi:hypothetical protein
MAKKPELIAYQVKNIEGRDKAIWTRIGAAFAHESGEGFSVVLDALPLDGRITLIEPKAGDEADTDD